jgi:titin
LARAGKKKILKNTGSAVRFGRVRVYNLMTATDRNPRPVIDLLSIRGDIIMFARFFQPRRPRRSVHGLVGLNTLRPRIEDLEGRLLLSTYLVTNTNDSGAGSLRQAILDSNGNPGSNTIDFSIGTGVQTIRLASALPTITVPVVLDGTSQPGSGNTPRIELDGSGAGSGADGLQITAGNSTVKGLAIHNFSGVFAGIFLNGAGGNTIVGNFIGTDPTGTQALGNAGNGVLILNSTNNTIGGTAAGAGNLISANAQDGVQITGFQAIGNMVAGNRIGTDLTGTRALGNHSFGVDIHNGSNNVIGGTLAGASNLISGGASSGVELQLQATNNRVQGNLIGTDLTGTQALGNQNNGVEVTGTGTTGNLIGGPMAGATNVIASNSASGVAITGGASRNVVQGDLIGTDITGTQALGNGQLGVGIVGTGTSNNLIGGTTSAARNVISASLHNNGVGIFGGATGNTVWGNYIGTDASGAVALANAVNGVGISDAGTSNNTIGGTAAGAGNVISGNLNAGIQFFNGSSGNLVLGNYVGTDSSGTQPLGNVYAGVAISGAANNAIGGTAAGAGNLISGNIGNGVRLEVSGTTGNLVQGNLIGTDVTGTVALGNGSDGLDSAVLVDAGASNNTIGGTAAGAGNVIAADSLNGVRIRNANGNLVQGNYIGTDVTGTQALGNGADGIAIGDGSRGNLIGGTAPGAGNVISANGMDGVHFFNGASGNTVQGNLIGTDVSGSQALGNGLNGVHLEDTSDNNLIGGPAAGNVIAFSGNDGVLVDTATGEAIQQNSIHDSGNLGIELINNANNGQAYPILNSAATDGTNTTVTGTLASTPDTTFTLDIYANAVANPSGNGEGEQYLGSCAVTTDDSGNASFTVTFVTGDTTGLYIAATATDPANDTSAFSPDVVVNGPSAPGSAGQSLWAEVTADRKLTGSDIPCAHELLAQVKPMRIGELVDQAFSAARAQHNRDAFALGGDEILRGIGDSVDCGLEGVFFGITDPSRL